MDKKQEQNTSTMSNRDSLRSSILGATPKFRNKIIQSEDGLEFEVRQPTIKTRADIRKAATVEEDGKSTFEPFYFMLHAAIKCTFVPGTDERVFSDEDFDVFKDMPSGGIIDKLGEAASELCNVDSEDAKKSKEKTKSES